MKSAEPTNKPKKQPTKIAIGLSMDKKYVQMIFPDRLEPMEGFLLTAKEARYIANLLNNKADAVMAPREGVRATISDKGIEDTINKKESFNPTG